MRECQDTSPIGIKRKKRLTFLSIRNFLCTDNNLVPVRWIEKSTRLALVYRRKKRRQGKEKQRYRSTLVRTCARETNREERIAAHSSLSLDWFALICSRWQEWSDEAHIEKKLFTHFSSQQLVHIVFKHAREKMSISLSLARVTRTSTWCNLLSPGHSLSVNPPDKLFVLHYLIRVRGRFSHLIFAWPCEQLEQRFPQDLLERRTSIVVLNSVTESKEEQTSSFVVLLFSHASAVTDNVRMKIRIMAILIIAVVQLERLIRWMSRVKKSLSWCGSSQWSDEREKLGFLLRRAK